MAWKDINVSLWDDFYEFVKPSFDEFDPFKLTFIWRGQADHRWSLQPSIRRALQPGMSAERAIEVEAKLVSAFKSAAHLHIHSNLMIGMESDADWWALMQHYRAPTRLLDWTASPFVAAYFAAADHWDRDGAIWYCKVFKFREQVKREFGYEAYPQAASLKAEFLDPKAPEQLAFIGSELKIERMIPQQGVFTVCRQIMADHADVIHRTMSAYPPPSFQGRIVIPQKSKPEFLARLQILNITAASLFPGMDGLGQSVLEKARLAPL